jgi:ABC-2 type transport system permease protein
MRPLLLFGVLYFVFTQFVKVGAKVDFYPVVLLENIVLYTFFVEGTGAVGSLVDRESLVRKIQFPRAAIPVAVVLTAGLNLVLNLLVVFGFAIASGVSPHWGWLEAPLLLAALAMLVTGLAALLSALYVRYRDVRPIWEVALQLIFYGSPVIYAIEAISASDSVRHIMMLNPLAVILTQMRHAVIDPNAPSAAAAAGGASHLIVPAVIVVGVFVLGWRVFDKAAPRIAEEL